MAQKDSGPEVDPKRNVHRLKSHIVKYEVQKAANLDNKLTTVAVFLIQAAVAVVAGNFTYTDHIGAAAYGYFRDVNLMIFFGFGFLMTFLHRHGLSAIGYCLVISALVVEMSIVVEYLLNKGDTHPKMDGRYVVTIEALMNALFCAGAVMISFGAVIGKVTPLQLLVMTVVEVFAFWANIRFCITETQAHDVGGGMVIHTFGAYFGLAATWWVTRPAAKDNEEEKSIYSSDIFSLAGTIVLWVLWPSFQSAVAGSEQRQILAISNTFFSLCSSTLAFAVFSRLLNGNKFDVVHMQNATLAGGVVMGVCGDMDLGLHGAMLSGFAAGALSCVGYTKLLPLLADKLNIHDTCGVNNLHGMPGILGAIVGIIVTAMLDNGECGNMVAGKCMDRVDTRGFKDSDGKGVGADKQAIALAITIAMALGCGTLAGFLMSVPLKKIGVFVPDSEYFNDALFFGEAEDYEDAVTVHKKSQDLSSLGLAANAGPYASGVDSQAPGSFNNAN